MDLATRDKWDGAAAKYDLFARGPEIRWADSKRTFFAPMHGNVLFLAAEPASTSNSSRPTKTS